jgi:alcohol dehydrogenase class IV
LNLTTPSPWLLKGAVQAAVGQRIAQMGYQSVLLVTDPGLMATGMLG